MKILAIETSCDETSIALIQKIENGKYLVLSHETISQINLHREYGGVYPTLSRREHEKNLVPLLHKVLSDSQMLKAKESIKNSQHFTEKMLGKNIELLERYPDLKENVFSFFEKYEILNIDDLNIAVTNGPGLPPALWVGVNFSKILAILLDKKSSSLSIYPINHMEGHIVGAISKINNKVVEIQKILYPVINLLISGGHTEIVLSDKNLSYKKIGETVDDAIGECFDKVARMLGLPYPGGPEIGKLAKYGRENGYVGKFKFPRPMYHSHDLNFSFSGLKTHILYFLQKQKEEFGENYLTEDLKLSIATEFEETIVDILTKKVSDAILQNDAKSLVVGGGVASSVFIKNSLQKLADDTSVTAYLSDKDLATDNALMIALTCANKIEKNFLPENSFSAVGSKKYEWL